VTEATKAVFLSYASQDVDAAHRICKTLREAGVEVWLDQSELRGGDKWDAAIRKQIQACTLFMPLISASTCERVEGYFRLEWKLAVDRSHLMAAERIFLVPVLIDGTSEGDALVPDKFREVQWTRLPAGEAPAAFVEQVSRLLSTPTHVSPASACGAVLNRSARPSVAVLPFDNLSGDQSQGYVADGLTEDLTTALSKYHWLRVIPRNSCLKFKDHSADARLAAKELEASYLVRGSVRRSGNRIRVSAQLIDGARGEQLWAESYDRDLENLLALQDEVSRTIAGRLEPELGLAERTRAGRKPAQHPGAWDCYHNGLSQMYRFTPDSNAEAQRLLRQAIELDPQFAQAHARLAYCMILEMVYFDGRPAPAALDEALRSAKTAVALDAEDAFCLMALGRVHIARREYALGQAACQAAVALNPSMGVAYCGMGDALAYSGRLADAIPCFEEAIRLSPNDPWRWAFYSYGALAFVLVGRYVQAVEWASQAMLVPNCQYWAQAHLVAALGHLGRTTEATSALAELKKLRPEFSLAFVREQLLYLESGEQVEQYLEGLRRAGLESHA